MPLTATHAELGLLDLTQPGMAAGIEWSAIHRATPRAPLSCRGCGGAMVAKSSSLANPFFAHHRRPDDCWLTGETMAHRLLKIALANAIRDAGWHAELELAGEGVTPWRADVMATAPGGARRIAFEAQLADIDADEIRRRSDNYAASDVEVCWIADRPRDWVGAAPYLVVSHGETGHGVELGLFRFVPQWCENRSRCAENLYDTSPIWRSLNPGSGPLPCPGHGSWLPVLLPLGEVVAFILTDRVRPVLVSGAPVFLERGRSWWGRDGHIGWTAQHYAELSAEQSQAEARYEGAQAQQQAQAAQHEAHRDALVERQTALRWPACEALGTRHGTAAAIKRANPANDEAWAMGVPIVLNNTGRVVGVVCPVASRVTPTIAGKLSTVVVVVATERERDRLSRVCRAGQEFLLLPVPAKT